MTEQKCRRFVPIFKKPDGGLQIVSLATLPRMLERGRGVIVRALYQERVLASPESSFA